MLNRIQLLLVRLSAADRGLEKLECSRGGTDSRNRSEAPRPELRGLWAVRAASGLWGCARSAPGTLKVD